MTALTLAQFDAAATSRPDLDPADLEAELDQTRRDLAKAHQVLRTIARLEIKAEKPDGLDDDPLELQIIAYRTLLARIHARIDLHFAGRKRGC